MSCVLSIYFGATENLLVFATHKAYLQINFICELPVLVLIVDYPVLMKWKHICTFLSENKV